MKTNNSKNLQVGDIVQHDDLSIGRVKEVEYNDADECKVEWWGRVNAYKASRTTIKYLTVITIPE